jgi:hypothetical protein
MLPVMLNAPNAANRQNARTIALIPDLVYTMPQL